MIMVFMRSLQLLCLLEIFHVDFSNNVQRIVQMTTHFSRTWLCIPHVVTYRSGAHSPGVFFILFLCKKDYIVSNSQKVARISQTIYPCSKILFFVHYPRSIFYRKKIQFNTESDVTPTCYFFLVSFELEWLLNFPEIFMRLIF